MEEKKKRYDLLLLFLVFLFLIIQAEFNFNTSKCLPESFEQKEYIFTGKYVFKDITLEQLDDLPKISFKDAKNIYKNKDGIKSFEDLKKIKGIKEKKLEILKRYIVFSE